MRFRLANRSKTLHRRRALPPLVSLGASKSCSPTVCSTLLGIHHLKIHMMMAQLLLNMVIAHRTKHYYFQLIAHIILSVAYEGLDQRSMVNASMRS